MESFGNNITLVTAIICYAIYEIYKLRKQPSRAEKYEELKLLHDLLGKGVITQKEFDDKKGDLLQ